MLKLKLIRCPALVLLFLSFASQGQLLEPTTPDERALVEHVSKGMSTCFTSMGAKQKFPTVAAAPPNSEMLAVVLLPASGPRVTDGYNYVLLLHGPSTAAFVVQLGGFAAGQTVYGPLPFNTHCR
jgi:hypothetical protein